MMRTGSATKGGGKFRCFTANGRELGVTRQAEAITVSGRDGPVVKFHAKPAGPGLQLAVSAGAASPAAMLRATLAALESLISDDASVTAIRLDGDGWADIAGALLREGHAVAADGGLQVLPEMLWQSAAHLWLPEPRAASYAQHHVMTGNRRHPRRAPKPKGVVYSRYIPWLDQLFTFRALDIDADLERFHRWMNDPRVAFFFDEEGDLAKHRAYLERIAADPHMTTLFGCMDGEPFCYFEVYWAQENRLGPYYDAGDYDRGWHVAVGEDGYRGRDYVATWLPSLMHYLLLDDARTQRIVGEPRADHHQQIRNLNRSGFASVKEFDFPHKRAMLVMLLRERYFGERLWIPRQAENGTVAGGRLGAMQKRGVA
jgi:hypothetical protein